MKTGITLAIITMAALMAFSAGFWVAAAVYDGKVKQTVKTKDQKTRQKRFIKIIVDDYNIGDTLYISAGPN